MTFQLGIDVVLNTPELLESLSNKRVALVAHPASITSANQHSLDALIGSNIPVVKAFGPQHGMRGDKQDNMIESSDFMDPTHQIPVLSLYGEHRKPTADMLADVDVVLFDLQDIGCRIYTYITTLKYFLEMCAETDTSFWVLDRPNPAGRALDGLTLEPGQESFVGCAPIPTRHGLTVGELAAWLQQHFGLDLDLKVIEMRSYAMAESPGYGWPLNIRPWVNPSPNAASLNMTRCFSGTVLLEGTRLSEGRGTTVPLEVIGAPDFPAPEVLHHLTRQMPEWIEGALIRPCFFSPTFHKHDFKLCNGLQIHTDQKEYQPERFKPFRLIAGLLKSLRQLAPDYDLWRYHEYEYELNRIPIDVINGGDYLRRWVDDLDAGFEEMEIRINADLERWQASSLPFRRY